MTTLVILDDEPRQVTALSKVIRKLKPDYVIYEEFDGSNVFQLLQSHQIDIIISDIRMPGMNGIDLAGKINKMKNPPKVVLLTGYDEFLYAVQALRYHAFDYILKPIGKPELIDLLNRLEAAIRHERIQKENQDKLMKQMELMNPVYEAHLLNRWIKGKASSEEEKKILETYFNNSYPSIVIIAEVASKSLPGMNQSTFQLDAFLNFLEMKCSRLGKTLGFNSSDNPQHIIILTKIAGETSKTIKDLEQQLTICASELDLVAPINVTFGLGNLILEHLIGITASYESALSALTHRFFIDSGGALSAHSLPSILGHFSFRSDIRAIEEAIHHKDTYRIQLLLNDHIANIKSRPCNPQMIKEEWYFFFLRITANNQISKDETSTFLSEVRECFSNSKNCYELKKTIYLYITRWLECMEQQDKNLHQVIIKQCIEYLKSSYQEDISLENVALQFHFNPTYFSTIFKSVTGLGFSEYIQKLRIHQAKFLIENTDYKMVEIAVQVGFKDATYFSKIFKKETGISPNKYKRNSVINKKVSSVLD